MESPYDVLLIEPDADEREIARAYRRRVLETHPDQGGSSREFQLVKAAYEALTSESGTGGPVWNGERDGVGGPADTQPHQVSTRVEYVNYEVLDDRGWDLDDGRLFERASAAGLDPVDYGRFLAKPGESLLEAAENRGFTWPYACRGGACANCAVALQSGELAMPVDHILPTSMMDQGIRLSCNGVPTTDEMRVVYNLKHRPDLDELRLPPHRFERDHPDR